MKKINLFVVGIIVIFGIGAIAYLSTSVETGVLKIGFVAPLTGDAAAFGEEEQKGVQLAIAEINSSGGIAGRQVEALYEDGKCSGQDAVSAAEKLVNIDKVHYIIGGACSGEAIAMVPVATAAQVLVISPSASAPKLSGISEYFVRNYPSDSAPGTDLAAHVRKQYANVAVLSENTEYAQGLRDVFVNKTRELGGNVVVNETFPENTTDFRTMLLKVKAARPDVVFINPQNGSGIARIATQARQLGITADFVGINYTGPDVLSAGKAVEGMVFAVAPGIASEGKGAKLIENYISTYGSDPAYPYVLGAAYDDVYLLKLAIEKRGDDATKVAQYLRSMPAFTGAIGTYSFDGNGDVVGIQMLFQKIQNGQLVPTSL